MNREKIIYLRQLISISVVRTRSLYQRGEALVHMSMKRNLMPEELFEQQASAYLVMKQGPHMGKRVELWKDVTTIGRSRECDIFLEDLAVHRKQASILFTDTGYILYDDHGSGDSFVNGRPIKEQLLTDGDQL